MCFAPEYLASFNLRTGEVKNLGLLGAGYCGLAQGENIVLDDEGCLWCNWSLTRAWQSQSGPDAVRLAKYDPRDDRIHFFQHGLPRPDGVMASPRRRRFSTWGTVGCIASGANGSFFRIEPASGSAELLFTPTPDRPSRLSSLAKTDDRVAYGRHWPPWAV